MNHFRVSYRGPKSALGGRVRYALPELFLTSERTLVAATIEFEQGGRTYRVKSGTMDEWSVIGIKVARDYMSIEKDLLTGQSIFVSWGDVPVLRLVDEAENADE
jgi:hypothetical protein